MSDIAFESLLWPLAQAGINLLDESIVADVFGGVIDQAELDIQEQRELYRQTLETKYGEPLESVMKHLPPIYRPLAAVQLGHEMAGRVREAEARRLEAEERARIAERQLEAVGHFRKKMVEKRERGRRKAKKQRARAKRKRK